MLQIAAFLNSYSSKRFEGLGYGGVTGRGHCRNPGRGVGVFGAARRQANTGPLKHGMTLFGDYE